MRTRLFVELKLFQATVETESFLKPHKGTNDFYCRRVKRITKRGLEGNSGRDLHSSNPCSQGD